MKKIVEEISQDCLEALLGERVTFFCASYIDTGRLIGIDENYALLTEPSIVYETGELTTKEWKDAQPLPHDWAIKLTSVESFGRLK